MKLAGHLWTIGPNLRHRLRPHEAPPSTPWSTEVDDPKLGPVRLRGQLSRGDPTTLVVLVHGLGGSPDSSYIIKAAQAAARAGVSSLRLALRGADRSGEDFYHAGLTVDLEAALASPALAGFSRVFLLGFSLGGHVSLRYGLAPSDPRVRAIASVCAPLDLHAGCAAIDAPRAWTYRRYLLRGLLEIYREVAQRRPVPTPVPLAAAARTMREWDRLTIVPRFGFASTADYYTSMSVGPRLGELALPALVVAAEHDPMVPASTLRPTLAAAPPQVTVRWVDRGGHVGFPRSADLGLAPGEVVDQALAWLLAR
ncbi:MAG: alpha/beta fold hydrolase [Myxococcales bacterium]|nr:alpha/beta fold hydrolase [Myxococcales bacterium]